MSPCSARFTVGIQETHRDKSKNMSVACLLPQGQAEAFKTYLLSFTIFLLQEMCNFDVIALMIDVKRLETKMTNLLNVELK